uniref:G-protein coupled receptors family 1 profile domain-containing protein n=1 Tax=Sphenodon punctatus TaxID=8508 RepID=A0A8D0GHB4_SPHPU
MEGLNMTYLLTGQPRNYNSSNNGRVLWYLCFWIRKNPFTSYITNLSIADIILPTMMFFLSLNSHLTSFYHKSAYFLSLFGYNTGFYLLTAISVERCISVFKPVWYRCHRPKHQSAIVCVFLWALSCGVTAADYFLFHEAFVYESTKYHKLIYCLYALNFLLFTPLLILSNLFLAIKIRRSSWRTHSSKRYIIILASVIKFLIFALPMRLVFILQYQYQSVISVFLDELSMLFSTINSSTNPLVYILVGSSRKKRFKESLKVVLNRAFAYERKARCQKESCNVTSTKTIDTHV